LKGREPQGTVEASEYDRLRSELIEKIEAIPDEKGRPIGTKVFRPEEFYQTRNGVAPDLMVYFGNLAWRSAGTVGRNSIHTFENDTGPDDANHGQHGIFIAAPAGGKSRAGQLQGLQIQDVAPTILKVFDLPIPGDMEGKVVQEAI
jgi:predicted AlkP superfamily phosphohydrolase/phosphomutase